MYELIILGISTLISAIALGFSIWANCKANKYRDIEKRLNELEIEERIENKHNKLKAKVKIVYKSDGWFEIKNTGNVTAENVDIAKINIDKSNIIAYKWFPITLIPDNSVQIRIKEIDDLKKIKIKLCWKDEYGEKYNEPREYQREFKLKKKNNLS